MVSPLVGLLLLHFASITAAKDAYIFHGVNQYEWESPDKLLYDYKGFVNPTVNKVIDDAIANWTWSEGMSVTTLELDKDPTSVYTKKPLAGESTSSVIAWNKTYETDFIGSIGSPRYPIETAIASEVVDKPYIIPCYDSPTLIDLDNSGYAKSLIYSNSIRLGPPPSFIANATVAFLQNYNVKDKIEKIGIAMLTERNYGNVPLGTSIKNKIMASYSDWTVSDYIFDSDALNGATTNKDYFFGTFKSSLDDLTEAVVQGSEAARIFIMIGSPEFIRYATLALNETLWEADGKNDLSKNEWIILAIPSNLYPLPSFLASDLMEIKLGTFNESNDNAAKQAYQSMFVLADDISEASYQSMSDYAMKHFNDSFSASNFNFPWTKNRKVPSWVGYYKDSYLIYLYMLKHHPNHDWITELKGKTFTANDFDGIDPYLPLIEIDQYGDRKWKVNFHHLDKTPVWQKVGTFQNTDTDYTNLVDKSAVAWPNGEKRSPLYIPKCGTYKKCPVMFTEATKRLLWLVVILVAVILIAAPIFWYCYKKSQYEMELNNMGWRIGPEELQSTQKDTDDIMPEFESEEGSVKSLAALVGEEDDEADHGHHENKAMYSNTLVALKQVMKKHFGIVTRDLMIEMKTLRDMRDEYIVSVIGLCIDLDSCWLVMEDCPKGTLESVLEDEATELDSNFKLNMIEDIAKGVYFIHQKLGPHGYLKTSNILVSKHFTMKVADFGEHVFNSDMNRIHGLPELEKNQRLLWRAPELTRLRNIPMNGTKAGDSYSFAIIMHEIINRQGPFNLKSIDNEETPTSIILEIKSGKVKRPEFAAGLKYKPLLRCKQLCIKCWNEDPNARPIFKKIVANLKAIKPGKSTGTFLDTAVKRLEKYSVTVEHAAVEKEKLAASEQKKVNDIMECFVPKSIVKKINEFEPTTVLDCTLAVIELVGCSTAALTKQVSDVVAMDTAFHTTVDKKRLGFEKVDIGAMNKVALLSRMSNNRSPHNKSLVKIVGLILQALEQEMKDKNMSSVMGVRAGLHTGFIKTGIVGDTFSSVQRFGVLGPTIAMAESLCSASNNFEMLVCPYTYKLVQSDHHDDDKVVFNFGDKAKYQDGGQTLEAYSLKSKDMTIIKHDEEKAEGLPAAPSAPMHKAEE